MNPISYYGETRIRLVYTGLLIVGVVLVLLGILRYQNIADVPGFWEQSTGIVEFSERLSADRHRPTVSFTIPGGKKITAASQNTFRRGFEDGETVRVRYDPLEPRSFAAVRSSLFGYQLYLFLGIIFSGVGFRLLVGMLLRNFRIQFIRENGKKVVPDRVTVETSTARIFITKKEIYYLRCLWTDPASGSDYVFPGEPLRDPPPLSGDGKIDESQVLVYFMPSSPDKYYIYW